MSTAPSAPAHPAVLAWREYQRTYGPEDLEASHSDPDTAGFWAAHFDVVDGMRVPSLMAALEGVAPIRAALTGEYIHETSFTAWGEPEKQHEDDSEHVVIYFAADNRQAAAEMGARMSLALVDLALGFHVIVSTAGDWAEQIYDALLGAPEPGRG